MDGDGNKNSRMDVCCCCQRGCRETFQAKKKYYQTVLPDKTLTRAFKGEAYFYAKYPLRVLVVHIGDSLMQVPLPHGKY